MADELLCARCGQWSFTAAHLHKHERAAHSSEHPRDCLQANAEEQPAPIKTEPEDETCADEFGYDEARIKSERALLYAGHEFKDEMAIGPTEIRRPPPGVDHWHWKPARRALANAGVDNEVAFLQRLYSSRLVLRDAADELLCARCGQWSLTAAHLHKHQRAAHSSEHPRDCLQPNACTAHQGNGFQAQPTALTDQRDNALSCDICSKRFSCKLGLNKHKRIHSGIRAFECDKSFAKKSNLSRHMLIHNRYKAFSCDTCGKSFTRKATLNRHMFIHNRYKPFSCDTCGKSFTRKSALSEHMFIHNRYKPFSCDTCGKSFTRKSTLSEHIMFVHNRYRPFSCDKCDKSFTRKSTLCEHMLIHNGYRPFSCDTCGKSFTRKSTLSEHIMFVHNRYRPFSCDKSFTRKSTLSEHMLIHNRYKAFSGDKCVTYVVRVLPGSQLCVNICSCTVD